MVCYLQYSYLANFISSFHVHLANSPPPLWPHGVINRLEERLLQRGHQRDGRRRGHRGARTGQLVVAEPRRRLGGVFGSCGGLGYR